MSKFELHKGMVFVAHEVASPAAARTSNAVALTSAANETAAGVAIAIAQIILCVSDVAGSCAHRNFAMTGEPLFLTHHSLLHH